MKKLINKPEDVVVEELQGIAHAHADLVKVHFNPNFIVRADAPVKGKVGVISGGGSGHEPMHGGFVGYGMLDAACPGAVFTSPTPDQMLASRSSRWSPTLTCLCRTRSTPPAAAAWASP